METSNIIAIALGGAGFIISIVGLIIAPLLNLRSKRLEKRLEYRFQLFQKVLELWEFINKNKSPDNTEIQLILLEVNKFIQLYGYNTEIKLFREVIDSYNEHVKVKNEINHQKLIENFNLFFTKSFNKYRNEIIMEKLD